MKEKIKICGMTDIDNISKILFLEPDYLGFIFYPKSPRCVVGKLKTELLTIIPDEVKKVGVFVDSSESDVRKTAKAYNLQVLQLHGNESPEMCKNLRAKGYEIIKVFSIESPDDLKATEKYNDVVDYFLFDTKTEQKGGSGKTFSWEMLKGKEFARPYFLSGGISIENIEEAALIGCYGLDLNSRFETEPGVKNFELLREALNKIRQ